LQELLPALAPNLSAPSGALRHETLRVLCAFQAPSLQAPPGAEQAPAPTQAPQQQGSDVLTQLLAIESRQMGLDSGRPAGKMVVSLLKCSSRMPPSKPTRSWQLAQCASPWHNLSACQ
jgi:hypothetical protein